MGRPVVSIDSMSRYVSPINPAVFPHLSLILLGFGIFFTAWFFVYEVTSTKFTRDIFKELLIALVAAAFFRFWNSFFDALGRNLRLTIAFLRTTG